METTFCLWLKGIVESLFIANAIECVNHMRHRFRLNPEQSPVVNIGYLQQSMHSALKDLFFTPEDLSHPPVIANGLSNLLLSSDDDEVSRSDSQDAWCMKAYAC